MPAYDNSPRQSGTVWGRLAGFGRPGEGGAALRACLNTSRIPLRKLAAGTAILLAVLGLLALFVLAASRLAPPRLAPGDILPDFALQDLEGRTITRNSFQGRKFALLFFRVTCPFCRQELRALNRLSAGTRLPIVAVSLSGAEETRRFRAQLSSRMDTCIHARAFAARIGLTRVPWLLLVDEESRIRYLQQGVRGTLFHQFVFSRFLAGRSLRPPELSQAYREWTGRFFPSLPTEEYR